MKHSLTLAVTLMLGLGAYAAQSSCVTCHTDPAKIKALYIPPSVAATEAEG
ncbi:MAG: hypothetical protein WCQ50_18520 [Spirochaetota bacterium]